MVFCARGPRKYTVNLLAVDLGAVSAFAFAADSERPVWGSIRFRAGSLESRNPDGLVMLELRRWELGLIDRFQPDWIACEPPWISPKSQAQTARRLGGYFMRTAEMAAEHNIGWLPCETWSVERHWLDTTRLKSKEKKQLTREKCRILGWTPVTEDEADALALLSYAQARLRLDAALLRGTMFDVSRTPRQNAATR